MDANVRSGIACSVVAGFFSMGVVVGIDPSIGAAMKSASEPRTPVVSSRLCTLDETALFECTITRRAKVALCGGQKEGRHYVQYRRVVGRTVVERFPTVLTESSRLFDGQSVARTMGGEDHIRFTRGATEYDVYSVSVGTDPGLKLKPQVRDGIFLRKDGKLVSDLKCVGGAKIPVDLGSLDELKD